jgi:hypothetical protein
MQELRLEEQLNTVRLSRAQSVGVEITATVDSRDTSLIKAGSHIGFGPV